MIRQSAIRRNARKSPADDSARILMESLEPRVLFSASPAVDAVAQANNAFAIDLLAELSKSNTGNVFFSPYSAATALEMALQGAKGVTAGEMIEALHLPSADIAQAGIQALIQLIEANPSDSGTQISTANRLWLNQNIPLLESFLENSRSTFGAAAQTVDFSNPQAAANTINQWVSDQTNGKITNLIPPDDLSAYTALVITNAIYFKGSWASPFNTNLTNPAMFQIDSTEAATVQMMQQTHEFSYFSQSGPNGFQALDLPYQGNNFDMLVILPTDPTLDQFQSNLTPELFSKISSNLQFADVDVQLPQFKINETYNLVQPLKDLGIQTAFSRQADFSGITTALPIAITDVIQKTFISVDENGTEAAAATAIVITTSIAIVEGPPPIPVIFDADHPFLFAIRDTATNTIVFMGRITDPSDGSADYATPPTAPTQPIHINPPEFGSIPPIAPPTIAPPTIQPVEITQPVLAPSPSRDHPAVSPSELSSVTSPSIKSLSNPEIGSQILQSTIGPFTGAEASPFQSDASDLLA
jgi:serpin B